MVGIEEYLRNAVRESAERTANMMVIGTMSEEVKCNDPNHKPLQTFPDGHSMISSKENGRDSEGPSFL